MTTKELFDAVLNEFKEQYRLELNYPYEDSAVEIRNRHGELIGFMNPDGYNLLYNLTRLCKMLSKELY